MQEIIERFRGSFFEDGKPKLGLMFAAAVGALVVLGIAWQVLVGPGGGEQTQAQTPPSGASGEPGGHDPLGKNGELSDEDQRAVRELVERFSLAAYGYGGADPDEYRRGVEELVTEDFWESGGAEEVGVVSEIVADGGFLQASGETSGSFGSEEAVRVGALADWRMTDEGEGRVEGVAYRWGKTYPLLQQRRTAQELQLAKAEDGSWKVDRADEAYEPEEGELARIDWGEEQEPSLEDGEREALEEGAAEYVAAMYGYEGADVEEYRDGVRGAVVGSGFADSPGGIRAATESAEVEERAGQTYSSYRSGSRFVWLDVEEVRQGEALGVAYYRPGSGGGVYGELVRLREESGSWKVAWAGGVSQVNESEFEAIQGGERAAQESTEIFGDEPSSDPFGGGSTSGTEGTTGTTGGATTSAADDGDATAVEEAVGAFTQAYDFEGTRADSYVAQIEPHVTDAFWNSPRGSENLANIEEIEAGGGTFVQDAELVAWEPVEVGAGEASGYATRSFESSVGDEAGGYTIRHELRLVKELGYWKVAWAGEPT